jgi:hypothetical protein
VRLASGSTETDSTALLRTIQEEATELAERASRLATIAAELIEGDSPRDDLRSDDQPGVPGLRLVATQMALAGASREMVSERLHGAVEPAELDDILEATFG